MSLASGPKVRMSYVREVTMGVTPVSPSMKTLRSLTRNLNITKNILESAEVRADRQVEAVRHGLKSGDGTVGYELSMHAADDMFEGLFGSLWESGGTFTTNNVEITNNSSFTYSGGGFLAMFKPGDYVTSTGFTTPANNGTFLVTAVTDTVITVATTSLSVEASDPSQNVTRTGSSLLVGTNLYTYSMERRFLDAGKSQIFRGTAVNSASLRINPGTIVNGDFGFISMLPGSIENTTLGTPAAPPAYSPFTSFDGTLREGGSTIAVVTGIDLNMTNGRTLEGVVGSSTSPEVFEGIFNLTGNLSAFFEDASLLDKFVNETESSIWLRLNDINSTAFMSIVIPRVKYTGGTIDPPSTGPCVLSMPFRGLVHPTVGSCIRLQRSVNP